MTYIDGIIDMNLQSKLIQHFGGIDKVMHALKGFAIFGIAVAIFTYEGIDNLMILVLYGNLVSLFVGLTKEYVIDYLLGGTIEFADVVATMKGSLLGTVTFLLGILMAMLVV